MDLVRTTIRLRKILKKKAEQSAVENNTTLQAIFNEALDAYLQEVARKKAKEIIFKVHSLGRPLDNLTRSDYYSEPNIK
ncbi:hypothetical protein A3A76_00235 [Candidatus Woesebacteria bacterium RIFCSPLOWO2_01_FULL_39_23]|uniref:Uncharacterized protein n=1 Tax=Candidatus Woesebacteria bacterium RIFCSPHIGHO2_01_FULL_40_22 TaxID=1802499 RepID=A0A1F7YGL8_9BACT|nr:MAG: hypothetical protein A2141_02905 [Candidatus Woesebacteria bacterium RBG_16_40_11]OGM26310.1 MAG: hypothetical protein A2628_03855 [Candidatus Woesebacteria bacterium RIFCSPHIGHO2_01_FULL_40_22]OGM38428.1 MAG: hypothetical protein A3E41_00175 [Candidatus Woesebacteria bacterium RIFCSPHIGHO2_12_FULL_38_9]OGM62865.1 MAG: hypothetical protein A3A76_00235 [Candidatus Woesebacteria bacterium RIFCSPLOWO2_01_FULL_39_23]